MSLRILYVEDNLLNTQLVQRMLKPTDYQLLKAFDGNSGFEMALHYQPDLILMDIRLPDVTGLDVIRDLKQSPTLLHIPVVALTGDASLEMRHQCLEAGCSAVLHKPVSRFLLLETIQRLVAASPSKPALRGEQVQSLKKVLIVEDNPDLRAIFARTFDRQHFSVHVVDNGLQALCYLETEMSDLIILDVNIPYLSGLEVLRSVRENPRAEHVKVVLVTGNCTAVHTPEAQTADLILLKPVNVSDLIMLAQRLTPPQAAFYQ